ISSFNRPLSVISAKFFDSKVEICSSLAQVLRRLFVLIRCPIEILCRRAYAMANEWIGVAFDNMLYYFDSLEFSRRVMTRMIYGVVYTFFLFFCKSTAICLFAKSDSISLFYAVIHAKLFDNIEYLSNLIAVPPRRFIRFYYPYFLHHSFVPLSDMK